jgi:hypothetical protein
MPAETNVSLHLCLLSSKRKCSFQTLYQGHKISVPLRWTDDWTMCRKINVIFRSTLNSPPLCVNIPRTWFHTNMEWRGFIVTKLEHSHVTYQMNCEMIRHLQIVTFIVFHKEPTSSSATVLDVHWDKSHKLWLCWGYIHNYFIYALPSRDQWSLCVPEDTPLKSSAFRPRSVFMFCDILTLNSFYFYKNRYF